MRFTNVQRTVSGKLQTNTQCGLYMLHHYPKNTVTHKLVILLRKTYELYRSQYGHASDVLYTVFPSLLNTAPPNETYFIIHPSHAESYWGNDDIVITNVISLIQFSPNICVDILMIATQTRKTILSIFYTVKFNYLFR